jgi:GTP cyclohydrolase I
MKDLELVTAGVAAILEGLGIEESEGTKDTPIRSAKAFLAMTEGYDTNVEAILSRCFTEKHDEMVLVKNIGVVSLCEHHLLPFVGRAHVAYIPDGKVLGLSKVVRLVRAYGQRLQLQERLTYQVAEAMMQSLKPKGVGVIVEASHMCMVVRGVKDQDALTTTSAMRGVFLKAPEGKNPKEEMLQLIYG